MTSVWSMTEPDWAPTADDALRAALIPILWTVGPLVLVVGLIWFTIDRPLASGVALAHLVEALLLVGLAFRWTRRPPASVNAAAALVIATLYLCTMSAMLAYPDPALCLLPVMVAMGAAVFVMDMRWRLAVQTFGAVVWGVALYLAPPSPQWPLIGFVAMIGIGAAATFRVARQKAIQRIHELREETEQRARSNRDAAAALRLSQQQLIDAQRIAKVGSYSWDIRNNRLRWSEQHYDIFGWDLEGCDVTPEAFFESVHPEDRPRLVEALVESLNGRSDVDLQIRIRRGDGEERVLHGRGETRFDETGKPVWHTGTSHDITELRRSEEALRSSEERLLAILEALDTSKVVLIDRSGIVRSILGDPTETGRYGIDPADVSGRPIRRFIPGAPGEHIEGSVKAVFETGISSEVDAAVTFPTGIYHFVVALRPLHDNRGNVESVIAIVRDVTERIHAARALEQARKLESLGVLAGGIAHDFNNLLVGVLGNAELALAEANGSSRLRAPLDQIRKSSERAAELTQHLLAYAGKAELTLQSANLAPLVDEMVQLLRASVSDAANIVVEHGSVVPWIHADVTQIGQVVMNFIRNAAEALEDDTGSVRIRTDVIRADRADLDRYKLGEGAAEGEFVVLEVADDGAGIERELLDRIFDPFFTTKFQGRGLGLASTLGIVRSHGGAIDVETESGHGTTFRVLLPLGSPAEEATLPDTQPTAAVVGSILVVDDEEPVRDTAARMLEAQGFDVIQASDGSEALELLGRRAVDAALLDVTMPGMSGVETFEAMRGLRPELPVVFMSGHSPEDIAARVSGKTRISQLQKPFRLTELRAAVDVALRP